MDNVIWMVYKILVVAGSLGVEAIKIKHSLVIFECALEELGKVIADMDYWISNYPPPGESYRELMAYILMFMENFPGVRLVGVG